MKTWHVAQNKIIRFYSFCPTKKVLDQKMYYKCFIFLNSILKFPSRNKEKKEQVVVANEERALARDEVQKWLFAGTEIFPHVLDSSHLQWQPKCEKKIEIKSEMKIYS